MTQQRVCVINVGSRGEKRGVLQLERERKRSRISKERKGMAIADFLAPTLFRLVTWRGRDRESHFLSQHVTYYQENERVISILN